MSFTIISGTDKSGEQNKISLSSQSLSLWQGSYSNKWLHCFDASIIIQKSKIIMSLLKMGSHLAYTTNFVSKFSLLKLSVLGFFYLSILLTNNISDLLWVQTLCQALRKQRWASINVFFPNNNWSKEKYISQIFLKVILFAEILVFNFSESNWQSEKLKLYY